MVVYYFSLCGPPSNTHEFTSPLCSHSRRVRTRLLMVALLHSSGGQVALLHCTENNLILHAPGGEDGSKYRSFVSFHVPWSCIGLRLVLDLDLRQMIMYVMDFGHYM
jgi:hypothetical protein